MKLYRVTNGYLGNAEVEVLVIAPDPGRAIQWASKSFKAFADGRYPESFWIQLTALVICSDLTREWVGEVAE